MKKLFLTLAFAACMSAQMMGQVTKEQLKGVWAIAAMGKIGEDSAVTFGKDTIISGVFTTKTFTDLAILTEKASSQEEKMAFAFMGMLSSMFIQFDGKTVFGEGMMEDDATKAPKVKRGTYKVAGKKVTTVSSGKTQNYTVEQKGSYLVVTADSGMIMYMKKISDTLY